MEHLPLAPETPHFRAATDLYATIHDEAVTTVRERFRTHAEREGYRGFVAVDHRAVVGFTYGHISKVGQSYHEDLRAALPAETYDRWLADGFELVELGVDAAHRRSGVASRLLETVLGGVSRPTALLTTECANDGARAFYESRGWTVIHEPFRVADTDMAVYGRDL